MSSTATLLLTVLQHNQGGWMRAPRGSCHCQCGCHPHRCRCLLCLNLELTFAEHCLCLALRSCHCADGLAALHRTGLHFFALAYCGSNLRGVARLLKACHLSASRAAGVGAERPLAQRSILGGLLPGETRLGSALRVHVPSCWDRIPEVCRTAYPPTSHNPLRCRVTAAHSGELWAGSVCCSAGGGFR